MPWSNQNGKKTPLGGQKEKETDSKAGTEAEKGAKDKPAAAPNPKAINPWAAQPKTSSNGAFSGRNRRLGGNELPPEVKKIFSKGQNWFNQTGPKSLAMLLAALLVVAWLFQCFYIVQQNERAVQLWLGKPENKIIADGLHFRLWPFETYYTVPLTEQNVAIGYNLRNDQSDSLMLSGDQNIVNVRFLVYYNITDPISYLFNVTDPIGTIRQVAESAMREVVGRRPIDDVYRDKREEVASDVLAIIQATVNKYALGVMVTRVSISEAAPPAKVSAAFNSVQQAEQERSRVIEEGNKIRATKLGLAHGEAARRRAEAQGEKARMIEEARGQAERFKALAQEEKLNPQLVRYRLYMETMGSLFSSGQKIIMQDKNAFLPHLPLNSMLGFDNNIAKDNKMGGQ